MSDYQDPEYTAMLKKSNMARNPLIKKGAEPAMVGKPVINKPKPSTIVNKGDGTK